MMVHIGTGSIDMTEKAFGTVAGILSAMPAQQRWDDGVAMGYAIALNGVDDKDGVEAVVVRQAYNRCSIVSVVTLQMYIHQSVT
jgi:hypothetical protein